VVFIIGDHHLKASLAKADQSLSLSGSFAQSWMNLKPAGRKVFLVNVDNAEVPVGQRKIVSYSSSGGKGLYLDG